MSILFLAGTNYEIRYHTVPHCAKLSARASPHSFFLPISCVAVWQNGRVEICANDQGNRITPSFVAWTTDGQRLVGDAAKNQVSIFIGSRSSSWFVVGDFEPHMGDREVDQGTFGVELVGCCAGSIVLALKEMTTCLLFQVPAPVVWMLSRNHSFFTVL